MRALCHRQVENQHKTELHRAFYDKKLLASETEASLWLPTFVDVRSAPGGLQGKTELLGHSTSGGHIHLVIMPVFAEFCLQVRKELGSSPCSILRVKSSDQVSVCEPFSSDLTQLVLFSV